MVVSPELLNFLLEQLQEQRDAALNELAVAKAELALIKSKQETSNVAA